MSQLINVADDVYMHLTRLKRKKKASYSEVIRGFYSPPADPRTQTLADLVADIRSRHKGLKPRSEPTDHDLILYGVSRARSR